MIESKRHLSGIAAAVISFAVGYLFVGLFSLFFPPGQLQGPPPAPMQPGKTIEFKPMTSVRLKLDTPTPTPNKPTKPFCRDRNILPVWNQIRRKIGEHLKYLIEDYGVADCSKMVEVMYFNLDGKGPNEILVWGKYSACGGTGNCAFWIFKKFGSKYREIFEASDYIDASDMGEQILRSKTKGFNDILVKGHINASDTHYSTYRYNGRRYVLSSDLVSAHYYRENGEVYWKFVTAKEYWDKELKR